MNLKTWAGDDDDWEFPFKRHTKPSANLIDGAPGTYLRVDDLHPDVKAEFGLEKFVNTLHQRIAEVHVLSISQGLKITLNGNDVKPVGLQLKKSANIAIGHAKVHLVMADSKPVQGRIYVGLAAAGEPNEDSGWWIFCNDRLLVKGDQSRATGWGEGLPQWHPQYAPFRGYVILYSENARNLPWNTTKDGIDETSRTARLLRTSMVENAKPTKKFIDHRKKELDDGGDKLKKVMDAAPLVSLFAEDLPEGAFSAPVYKKPARVPMEKIIIRRPKDEVAQVKERLMELHELGEPPTSEQAGNQIFDYFVRLEIPNAQED